MFKKNHLMLLMLLSTSLIFGSEKEYKDTEHKSYKRTYDHINPLPLADYIVTLNCKKISLSSHYERSVDPLKLQKLLYYAFSHIKVNFGVNLWDIERYPLVAYQHGPFSWDIYHDGYRGKSISGDQIEKAYTRSGDVALDDHTRIWLNVIDRLYKGETGITLRNKSHRELPYLRVEFQQPLALLDIGEEFWKLEHRLSFVKALFSLSEDQFNCVVPDSRSIFEKWKTKEFSALLEDDQQSGQLPAYAKIIIGKVVYPTVLVQNFDAKDNLFSRPDVIERVAVSASFGNKIALQHLIEIFEHYTIDQDDAYDKTSQYLQTQLDSMVEGSDYAHLPDGLEEYQQAQKQTTFEDAQKFYLDSLRKGYARSAFELAKMHFSRSETTAGVNYLQTAFEKGMLTATDMLLPYLCNEAEKIEYLKRRGDSGDSYGYYELAKHYESRGQFSGKEGAISYYFKAQPFFGYTELMAIQKKYPPLISSDLNEEALDDFFKDIIQILNIGELNTIWNIET
jgi:uncharacterized phage-associated protein